MHAPLIQSEGSPSSSNSQAVQTSLALLYEVARWYHLGQPAGASAVETGADGLEAALTREVVG